MRHRGLCGSIVVLILLLVPGSGVRAERPSGAPPDWPEPIHDSQIYGFAQLDRLEFNEGDDGFVWDGIAWVGGDLNRFWLETEGEVSRVENEGAIEGLDLQYGRLISPYWDLQVGIGYQRAWGPGPDPDRVYLLLGVQGLAPYWFEVDANVRLSEDGDVSAGLAAEYDLLLTQRWVLQSRLETSIAFQATPAFGAGSGLTGLRLGTRLRYEIRREFAPYAGVTWNRLFGETADMARGDGFDTSTVGLVAGLRLWF